MVEQRRTKRYDIHAPLELVGVNETPTCEVATTLNISSNGILFEATNHLHVGCPVVYIITLIGQPEGVLARLRCSGKVVRVDRITDSAQPGANPYAVAASLDEYEFARLDGEPQPDCVADAG